MKIAITGVLGAGKSTTGQILVRLGHSFISADVLSRKAIAPDGPAFQPLLKLLGPTYLNKKGHFDTQKVAHCLFQDPKLLQKAEKIIHPKVYDLLNQTGRKPTGRKPTGRKPTGSALSLSFYEIPLLFEKHWDRFFLKTVVIAIDPEKQVQRLQKKRGFSLQEIKDRQHFQMSQEEKIQKADYVIWNNDTEHALEKKITKLWPSKLRP